jgi:hypothetical protein
MATVGRTGHLAQQHGGRTGPRPSTRALALASRVTHSFHIGMGHFDHRAPPPMPAIRRGLGHECDPPTATPDESPHLLLAPGSAREMRFLWVAREHAWERPGGIRMAFTAAYLAAHGWKYARAV